MVFIPLHSVTIHTYLSMVRLYHKEVEISRLFDKKDLYNKSSLNNENIQEQPQNPQSSIIDNDLYLLIQENFFLQPKRNLS